MCFDQLDRPRTSIFAIDDAFLAERLNMLVHRGRGGELEPLCDLPIRRCVPMLLDEQFNVGENIFLFFGERWKRCHMFVLCSYYNRTKNERKSFAVDKYETKAGHGGPTYKMTLTNPFFSTKLPVLFLC